MGLDDVIALLGRTPLLDLLERDALRLLAFSAETRRLRAGEVLFREGDRSDGGYVVLAGTLETARGGSDATTLAESGALVGRMALFLRGKRPASARATERSEVLRVSATLMRRVLEEFPAAAEAMREALAADLDELTRDLQRARTLLTAIDRPADRL